MQAVAQTILDALGGAVPVYVGPEALSSQPQLPHVIVIPTAETAGPPRQAPQQLASEGSQTLNVVVRAVTFEDARDLALIIWKLPELRAGPEAQLEYGTEPWGQGVGTTYVRSATLTLTLPTRVPRTDVTLARLETILAHHRYLIPPTPQEVPDDQDQAAGGYRGDFHEHGDPPHREP